MNIYPMPAALAPLPGVFHLSVNTKLSACKAAEKAAHLLEKRFNADFHISIQPAEENEPDILLVEEACAFESYRISVSEKQVEIFAGDEKGFLHATQTFLQMVGEDLSVPCAELSDAPAKEYRGLHLYMPSPSHIEECKRLFDVLSFLKYNTVILEIGGTMELRRHPEVNAAWVKFCKTITKDFPGGPQNFQWADRYWKDSTHYENARGEILSQEQVRDIVGYAKDLGFTVIPEIQALSHAYYLTIAHPEIAEDKNDLFPDTYCPMNEESYKLYFDVAEEIIEVVKPEIVSIGHDEIRILGECPVCREKSGHELLAYEINRLHAFYKEKNIRIMMWAEKLMPPIQKNGLTWGGGADETVDDYGRHWKLPATYKALEGLPKDIIMLDWYHSRGKDTEMNFIDGGFEVMFGNYSGIVFGDWDKRGANVIGAEISTWCTPDCFTLGRNGVMFDLIFTAELLWGNAYSDEKYAKYLQNAMGIAEKVRRVACGGKKIPGEFKPLYYTEDGMNTIRAASSVCTGENAKQFLKKREGLSAVSVDTAHVLLETSIYAKSLLFCESFKKPEEKLMSYSFINAAHWDCSPMSDSSYICANMPRWTAAVHEIQYEDGTVEIAKATYGITAADVNMSYARERLFLDEGTDEIDVTHKAVGKREAAPHFKLSDPWQSSVLYFTDTIVSNDVTAYVYEWRNPYPEKKIIRIKVVNTTHDKTQSVLLFALGYKK